MATGSVPRDGITCRRCAFVNHSHDRYCAQCGDAVVIAMTDRAVRRADGAPDTSTAHTSPVPIPRQTARGGGAHSGPAPRSAPPPPSRPGAYSGAHPRPPVTADPPSPAPSAGPSAGARDDVTRYLCAAAHLDAAFADAAVAEYLVEPARALPPSLGVNTVAVLREAVAARARRKARDGVLLLSMAFFTLLCLPVALLWLLAAVGVEVAGRRGGSTVRLVSAVVAALTGVVLLGLYGLGAGAVFSVILFSLGLPPSVVASTIFALLPALVIVVVLALDEAAVAALTRHDFRERNFVVDATSLPPGRQRNLRTWGLATYSAAIDRVAAQDAQARSRGATADVIVYRDREPFIGAGVMVRDETLALPLVPDEDADEPPVPFVPSDLHAHVSRALAQLRNSASLSPGGRLGNLSIIEQVFFPAEQMLRGSGTTLRPVVLPHARRPPIDSLPLKTARRLADEPQEAARYYRCYRVESWDRDLTTSSYFTAGTDRRTLYLEWTHSVLNPIRGAYRDIDRHPASGPGRRALEATVTFPVSIPVRLVGLFRVFRPAPHGVDEIEPSRYGAGPNLRELAAARDQQTFFQEADAVRYIQIVEQAFFTAIGTFLQERHYSIADVLGVAKEKISNSITIENGTFVNSAIGNTRVRQTTTAAPATKERA